VTTRETTIRTAGLGGVDAVPAYLDGPTRAEWLLVMAPGAGAPADGEFMATMAHVLADEGVRVLRFDFPYQVRAREDGRRRPPDRPAVLEGTWRAAIRHAGRRLKPPRMAVGGKSMGGRYATMLLAEAGRSGAEALPASPEACILFGYPLHPPGKPEKLRAEHLVDVGVPMLFLGGTRDALARIDLLRRTVADLPASTLHEIEGADHDFRTRAQSRREVIDELARAAAAFLNSVALRV